MKNSEIIKKTKEELENLLAVKREDLRKFRFGNESKKIKDVKFSSKTRKDIARILTNLSDK